jgi:hypothetical protein
MNVLDTALPGFLKSCAELHQALLPVAMTALALAFAIEFWDAPASPIDILKFLVKVFCIVLLIAQSHEWINQGQSLLSEFLAHHVPASPDKVAQRFKDMLALAQNAPEFRDQSLWKSLFSSKWFDAIILAVLMLVSWLAIALQFFSNIAQTACLHLCWCLGPLLLPAMAIRPISRIGIQHLLRTISVLLWPFAMALASTITSGLLDAAANGTIVANSKTLNAIGSGLVSLLCLAAIAGWITVSIIAGPVVIHRFIVGGADPSAAVSRVTEMATSTALSVGFAVPAMARRTRMVIREYTQRTAQFWRSRRGSFSNSADGAAPSATTVSALPSVPPASAQAAAEWQPTPDDPTGDRRAQSIARPNPHP